MGVTMLVLGGPAGQGAMLAALTRNLQGFTRLAVAVSYVQLSGWALLAPLVRGRTGATRVLCTDQLGITDPAAVRAMQAAGVDVRAWAGRGVYHPKLYVASRDGQADRWMLGSANISRSALVTGVEAGSEGEDPQGTALAWFDAHWNGPALSQPFDATRLAKLDQAFAGRVVSSIAYARAAPAGEPGTADPGGSEAVEQAFAALAAFVVPLNADQAGNNVRTLHRVADIADGRVPLKGKASSEMKLLGFAFQGSFTPLGRDVRGRPEREIAERWMTWLKHASDADLARHSPSGMLRQARIAYAAFWRLPKPVRDWFVAHATRPSAHDKQLLQTIELLANTARSWPILTMADVGTLTEYRDAAGQLAPATEAALTEYLANKGRRGWDEHDRVLLLEAWRDAP